MIRLLINVVAAAARAVFGSREDIVLENIALRQQLAVLKGKCPVPGKSISHVSVGSPGSPPGKGLANVSRPS